MLALLLIFGARCTAEAQSSATAAKTVATSAGQTPVPQGQAAYSLPPELLRKARTYARERATLFFTGEAWSLLVLAGVLALGLAVRMRRFAVTLSGNRWVQGLTYSFLLLLLVTVLALPFGMVSHHLAVVYGQSVQGWGSWFGDALKSFVLTFLVGGLLVMLLFRLIRRSPERWWLWLWVALLPFLVLGVFVAPVLIDPMFNHFEPLARADPALVARLERVAAKAGVSIPPDRMFLMRASDKVTGLNAYVTGIGASKRVVVWDTTLARATPDEIALIFGHELGHYVLNHIWKGLLFTAALMLVGFFVGALLLRWLLARFGRRWGVLGQDDWAALPAILLVFTAINFLLMPVVNAYSRMDEHHADVFGQEVVHGIVPDPQRVGQRSFDLLGRESLADPHPNPFVVFWTYSHPPIASRAAFAASYNPWQPGREPRYFPGQPGSSERGR